MAHDVFVSYSSRDATTALAVVNALESAGVRCWIAPRDVKAGDVWAQAIVNAIGGARVMIVVFSSHSNRSPHVVNEVDAAIRKGSIVIPFRIENVVPDGAMEYHLRTRHWLDALTPDLDRHIKELVGTVASVLGQPATPVAGTEFGAFAPAPPAPPRPAPEPRKESPAKSPASKSRPQIQTTDSAFHVKLPKPTFRLTGTKVAVAVAIALLVGVSLIAGSRLFGGGDVIGVEFEAREQNAGNEFRSRIRTHEIRFYEAGRDRSNRNYGRSFAAAQARYIYTELGLRLDPPQRYVSLPVNCTIFNEAGGVTGSFALANRIEPNASQWYNSYGWGNQSSGSWKAGKYRVDCRYGDKLIARSAFTILN